MQNKIQPILDYIATIKTANNETVRRELFSNLLLRLFDEDDRAKTLLDKKALGAETAIRIPLAGRTKTGFADNQFNRLLLEFKDKLQRKNTSADQLAEYLLGNWKKGEDYDFTLIATDGEHWKIFAPDYSKILEHRSSLNLADIQLLETDSFTVSEAQPLDFYFFLDRYFFKNNLQEPTLENIQHDFGRTSAVFLNCMDILSAYFQEVKNDGELRTALSEWNNSLRYAYGKLGVSDDVFLVHTYLSLFAKMLAYDILTKDEFIDDNELEGIVTGSIFEQLNVHNFTEADFFAWVGRQAHFPHLKKVFRLLAQKITQYDFRQVREDILKGVYQELIDLETRHALGEYYTPDWLCERIVAAFDFQPGECVLDPACGSGSFLRAVVDRLKTLFPDMTPQALADAVHGIDVHPLSVQIAKTTVLLAIGGEQIKRAKSPVTLNVTFANSLLNVRKGLGLFTDTEVQFKVDGKLLDVSKDILTDIALFDEAVGICERLAEFSQGKKPDSPDTIAITIRKKFPQGTSLAALQGFHEIYLALKTAKEQGRDSIWRFILQNLYRPLFLRGKFDYVVGNPPWLTYADFPNGEYQDDLLRLANDYAVTPERKANMPHLEIAAIFLAHCARHFLKKGGRLAFVLPRSFFSADHHDNTRSGRAEGFKIESLWDLDDVTPLFRVPSCVIFAKNQMFERTFPKVGVPGFVVAGRLPKHNLPWTSVETKLRFAPATWHYSKLGKSSAFTDYRLETSAKKNHYKDLLQNGANMYPRNFYFVDLLTHIPSNREDWGDRLLPVRSAEAAQADAKPPWKKLTLQGKMHSRFLFRTALARNILPFALLDPVLVALPAEVNEKQRLRLLTPDELVKHGWLDEAKWFGEVEKLWEAYRTDKNKNTSALSCLNWQNKLTEQDLILPFLALYSSSAKDANAFVLERGTTDLPFVVENAAYVFYTDIKEEAYFLTAFLNSEAPNLLMKDFQARGLFGARHVHKKILDVPFPKYDGTDERHVRLAALGKLCHERAGAFLATEVKPGEAVSGLRLGGLRLAVKRHLREELAAVDEIVKALIG